MRCWMNPSSPLLDAYAGVRPLPGGTGLAKVKLGSTLAHGHHLDSQTKSRGDHFHVVEQIIAGLIRCAEGNTERGTCTT